jgi:signal transduction histidine kinase
MGIFVDILDSIAKNEGWAIEYVHGTWPEGLDRLEAGEIDLMPDVAFSKQRETVYAFHREPVLSDWFQVYVRRGTGIRSLLDPSGKRIAVLRRSVQQEAFEKATAGFDAARTRELDSRNEDIARLYEEVRRHAGELEKRVEERTRELVRANRDLLAAREKAESADRVKSAFPATMSHELRTPLNSIVGFTGILLQKPAGPLNEEQEKQLRMVQDGSRHLLALINDVLDISRIEAGQLTVSREPFDLRASIEKVVRTVEPAAERRGLYLRAEIGPEVGTVVSDRRRVEQALVNLLGNAVKFTEDGGVTVACRIADGSAVVSVRDTGIGIAPGDIDRLFRPFEQIDSGPSRKYEGTGLGLSICRRLLDLMGGTISVESEPGAGSVFTFRLPVEPDGTARATPPESS